MVESGKLEIPSTLILQATYSGWESTVKESPRKECENSRSEHPVGFQMKVPDQESNVLVPTIQRCELPTISVDTMKEILSGERKLANLSCVVIDCRHKFEFNGGHIKGARNLQDPSSIDDYYLENIEGGRKIVVVLHCEFSSARAPKLFRHMRNVDRQHHMEVYPELGFPHMYILQGGYKAFYETYPDLCEPREYVSMTDPLYVDDLRASNKLLKRTWTSQSSNSKNSRIRSAALTDVSNGQSVKSRTCSVSLKFDK